MSAIASFYVVHRDLLAHERMPVARLAAEFGRVIDSDEFPYSGYLMMDIMLFLEEREIPITHTEMEIEYGGEDTPMVIVLTSEHRPLLPDLDPATLTLDDMRKAMEEYDFNDDEIVEAVTDALNVLRNGITNLADDEALIITIG
jgi:hypothetical protein